MKHDLDFYTQHLIKREQDVTDLIGHIGYNGHQVIKITGNNPKNGFVEFDGDSSSWLGFDCLRDDCLFVDITGLGIRKAMNKIRDIFPSSTRFMKEKHLKMQLEKL